MTKSVPGQGYEKKTHNKLHTNFIFNLFLSSWGFLSDNKTNKVLYTIEEVNKILSMVFFSCIIKYFFRQSDSRCQQFEGVSFIEYSKKNENICEICLLCLVRVDGQLLLPNTHDNLIVLYLGRKNGEVGNGSFLQRDATDRPIPVRQHALFPGHPPVLTVMQEAEGGVKYNSFY